MKNQLLYLIIILFYGAAIFAQTPPSMSKLKAENSTFDVSKYKNSRYVFISNSKDHRKSIARNYDSENLDFSGMNLKAAHEKIYSIIASIAKKKLDTKLTSTYNFLTSAVLDSRGTILEVEFLVNELTPLTAQDFEAIEKAILTSVKVPITKPELYKGKNT
jgi:hypothetical protein